MEKLTQLDKIYYKNNLIRIEKILSHLNLLNFYLYFKDLHILFVL